MAITITPTKHGFIIARTPCATCGEPPFGDEYCCGHVPTYSIQQQDFHNGQPICKWFEASSFESIDVQAALTELARWSKVWLETEEEHNVPAGNRSAFRLVQVSVVEEGK